MYVSVSRLGTDTEAEQRHIIREAIGWFSHYFSFFSALLLFLIVNSNGINAAIFPVLQVIGTGLHSVSPLTAYHTPTTECSVRYSVQYHELGRSPERAFD